MSKSIWCPLPWSHLSVKNNGTLRLCSHSQSAGTGNTVLYHSDKLKPLMLEDLNNIDVLNSETLKEVRRNFIAGNWPTQCLRCQVESQSGGRSRDQWETEKHKNIFTKEEALMNTLPDGTVKNPKFITYDLRVGFQCNLRCVMCFPAESSRWYKDYEELMQKDCFRVDDKLYDLDIKNADFDWVRSEEKVSNLLAASKYVRKITFGGGEPLMIKHCINLVEKLVDIGHTDNIELEYSINLTTFPTKLWDLWKNFKKVVLCCSIDAFGIANEAIRYPSKWNTIEKNLDMLDNTPDNMQIFTSTTISMLSLEHYADFMLWLDGKNYKKINKGMKFSATHPVYYDKCLNIAIMEEEDLYKITASMKDKIRQSNAKQKKFMIEWIEFYENFYQNMKIEEDIDSYRKQFADQFYRFAKNQNQDWDKIFPMSSKMAKKWGEKYS